MARAKIAAELAAEVSHADRLASDAEIARLRGEVATLRARYKTALSQIDAERERADSLLQLQGIKPIVRPKPTRKRGRKNAATMVVLLSDVHCEEVVHLEQVNGLNEYNPAVCDKRLSELQERFFRLLEHERQLADIDRVVVWLGGDLISGMIHPELAETNASHPLKALRWIGARMRTLIDAVAQQAGSVIVATNSGNHGRATEKLRVQTELDWSYEQHLYLTLAAAETNANVEWKVATGELNYVTLDAFTIRFLHGFSIKYQGGTYGLALPAMKAISAWDASRRADLTCFGHYHSFGWLRAGRYVSNGSVIGHSPYAVRIKAGFEAPCQAAIVIDHARNEVTRAMPIWCDRDLRSRS
jgi:hypothetical protein